MACSWFQGPPESRSHAATKNLEESKNRYTICAARRAKPQSWQQIEGGPMRRRTFVGGVFAGLAANTLAGNLADAKEGSIVQRTLVKSGEQSTVTGQAGGRSPLISSEKTKARTLGGNPALTLDDLATAWMPRRVT